MSKKHRNTYQYIPNSITTDVLPTHRILERTKGIVTMVLLASILLLVVAQATFKINDPDTIHYLATGKDMVTHGLFTHGSSGMCVFNYTDHTCQSVFYHEWLFHLITYGVYAIGGWNGLGIFQILIDLSIFIVILIHAKRATFNFMSTGIFLLFAALIAVERFMLRADSFGLLLLVIFYSLIDDYVRKHVHQRERKVKIIYICAIMLTNILWANTHGSFPLAFIIVGAYIGADLVKSIWKKLTGHTGISDVYELKELILILVLAVGTSFINPFGIKAVYGAFDFFFNGFAHALQQQNLEWQSPFKPSDFQHLTIIIFKILVVTSCVIFISNIPNLRLSDMFLFIPIAYLAVTYVRNVALFSLISALVLPHYLDNITNTYNKFFKNRGGRYAAHFTSIIVGIVLTITCLFLTYWNISNGINLYDQRSRRFGLGLNELSYPIGAIEFVQKHNLTGNVFNDYASGTYINWTLYPRYKSFIDGDTFSLNLLRYYNQIVSGQIPYAPIVTKYNINYFLFQYSGYDSLGLMKKLYNDPAWKLVFLDETSCIFLANTPQNKSIIDEFGIDFTRKNNFDIDNLTTVKDAINISSGFSNRGLFLSNLQFHELALYQFKKAVSYSPKDYVSRSNLGAAYSQIGQHIEAAYEYEQSIAIQPHFAPSHFNLGLIYQYLQRYDDAITQFKQALRINRTYSLANLSLGLVYEAKGDIPTAKKYYLEELAVNPRNIDAENNLTRLQGINTSGSTQTSQTTGIQPRDKESLLQQLKEHPNDPNIHFHLGIAYGVRGDQSHAIAEFQKAVELKPDFTLAHFNLGNAYSLQKEINKAQTEYELAIKYDPTFADAYLNLALIYQSKRLDQQAIDSFQTYLQLHPSDPQAEQIREQIKILINDRVK